MFSDPDGNKNNPKMKKTKVTAIEEKTVPDQVVNTTEEKVCIVLLHLFVHFANDDIL